MALIQGSEITMLVRGFQHERPPDFLFKNPTGRCRKLRSARHGRRHQRGLWQTGRDHRILCIFGAEELGCLG